KPRLQHDESPRAPKIELASNKAPMIPPAAPVIPRQPVKTNVFSTGSSEPATIAKAPEKVQTGGFGDPNGVPARENHGRPINIAQSGSYAEVGGKIVPADITAKPNPTYTDEARKLRIEGEVLLEVVFESSGNLHILRVVHGLGHGLDEAAVRAAQKIRFKPAQRDGQPADSTAVLHVIFQIA